MSDEKKSKFILAIDPGGITGIIWVNVSEGKINILRIWEWPRLPFLLGKLNRILENRYIKAFTELILVEDFTLDQKKGLTDKGQFFADHAKSVETEIEGLAHQHNIACERISPTFTGILRESFEEIWQRVGGDIKGKDGMEGEDLEVIKIFSDHLKDTVLLIVQKEFPEVAKELKKRGGESIEKVSK